MIRTLLTTTALTAMLVTGAYAQDANAPANTPAPADQTQSAQPSGDNAQTAAYAAEATDHMASKIIGMKVYNSADSNGAEIGDVNDLVVNKDGTVAAIVVGVGGFLGVGEKNVALPYSGVQWSQGDDGTPRLVVTASKDALTAAPEFKAPDENANGNAGNGAMDNGNAAAAGGAAGAAGAGAMSGADNAAGNDNAAAPADSGAAPADDAAAPADNNGAMDNGGAMAPGNDAMSSDNAANAPAANAPAASPAAPNAAPNAPAANAPAANAPAVAPPAGANANANANAPEVDMSKLTPLAPNSLKTSDLKGIDVVNPQGDIVGQIGDFVLTEDGKVDAVIVDFGGFLGIGQKQVALGLDNLQFESDDSGKHYLVANVTKDEVEQQAAYNKDDYQKNRDQERLVVKDGGGQ